MSWDGRHVPKCQPGPKEIEMIERECTAPSREKIAAIIEDNIYRKHNGNWDGDAADLLVAADAILAAFAVSRPDREAGA